MKKKGKKERVDVIKVGVHFDTSEFDAQVAKLHAGAHAMEGAAEKMQEAGKVALGLAIPLGNVRLWSVKFRYPLMDGDRIQNLTPVNVCARNVSGALVTAISKVNRDMEAKRREIEHDDDLSPNDKKAALARVFNVDVDSVVDVHEMDSDITVARVIREPANGEPHQS